MIALWTEMADGQRAPRERGDTPGCGRAETSANQTLRGRAGAGPGDTTSPALRAGAKCDDRTHLSMLDFVSAILFRLDILNPYALPLWPLFM